MLRIAVDDGNSLRAWLLRGPWVKQLYVLATAIGPGAVAALDNNRYAVVVGDPRLAYILSPDKIPEAMRKRLQELKDDMDAADFVSRCSPWVTYRKMWPSAREAALDYEAQMLTLLGLSRSSSTRAGLLKLAKAGV